MIPDPALKSTSDTSTIVDVVTAKVVVTEMQTAYNELTERFNLLLEHVRGFRK